MCFFCVLFVFGREEKCVEMIQAERKTQKSSSQNVFFFFFEGCLGPFIASARFLR